MMSTSQEVRRKRAKVLWRCVNSECGSTMRDELLTAPAFVVACFDEEPKEQKRYKVCTACNEAVVDLKNDIKSALASGSPISPIDTVCLKNGLESKTPVVTLDEESEEESVSDHSEFETDLEPTNDLISVIASKLKLSEAIETSINDLERRVNDTQKEDELDQLARDVQRGVDELRAELYKPFRRQTNEVERVDSRDNVKLGASSTSSTPSQATVSRPALSVGSRALGSKADMLDDWELGTVVEVRLQPDNAYCYTMSFGSSHRSRDQRALKSTQLAYAEEPGCRLGVGTRVVALFRDPMSSSNDSDKDAFYPAVVGEPPKVLNNYRYLVFFDDGYTSYVKHEDLRLVCGQSKEVWQDVHPNSRLFVQKYLKQYPDRPMVRLAEGQRIKTEWQGSWLIAKVLEVDSSLVKLLFPDDRTELIYRGSTRLLPLFLKFTKQSELNANKTSRGNQQGHARRLGSGMYNRRNVPVIEYTRQLDHNYDQLALARKSTSMSAANSKQTRGITNKRVKQEEIGESKPCTNHPQRLQGRSYKAHTCNEECVKAFETSMYYPSPMRGVNPLLIPILLGWDRQMACRTNTAGSFNPRRQIYYVAPCGRRLRSLREIHNYLLKTESQMEIDFFSMGVGISVFNEFIPSRVLRDVKDLSYGRESVPVPAVNSLDNDIPSYVEYSRERLPQEGVHINTSTDFLVSCDCKDGCADATKCACRQLTVECTNANQENITNPNAGYDNRRLLESVTTGIYECNSSCKCNHAHCLNRVAQNPLRNRLQVFKTASVGWGLRTLCDMPKGCFVCIYVGNLYTNQEANRRGAIEGDEYFAELDHIDTIEAFKYGYEEGVENCDLESQSDKEHLLEDSDDDLSINGSVVVDLGKGEPSSERVQRTTASRIGDEDVTKNLSTLGLNTSSRNSETAERGLETTKNRISTRKLFGPDEEVYIMDAKAIGNLGRYMNHSCDPNIIVQNCYVDTHDLRFPWVAFFTSKDVKAGEELRWDYNYPVVEGKEIKCECGAESCMKWLL